MKPIIAILILIAFGLVFFTSIRAILYHMNELKIDKCKHCEFYDPELNYCWVHLRRQDGEEKADKYFEKSNDRQRQSTI